MAKVRRFGKYVLHDQLAVGGMGELYFATKVAAARGTPPSVLKILLPEYAENTDFVSMFHDEARIGMQLAHPNVVAVLDIGLVDGSPFLVMEYVHGENLRSIANRLEELGEAFPPDLAVRIAVEVLNGLDYAHTAKDARGRPMNLVHRDLSPDNVIVSFDGDVKVLDFGIAKADGRATQTMVGTLKGKTQYMSPEQALGKDIDARSDIHAVGILLLEILVGARRFPPDRDPIQQIRDARVWKPTPPSRRNPSLPVELDAIILKSTEIDPKNRFQTADEFAVALDRLRREKMRGGSENVLRLLRRLFPDREEPFLQFEEPAAARVPQPQPQPAAGSDAEIGFDEESELPSESEILGAFLGGTASGGRKAAAPPQNPPPSPPQTPARTKVLPSKAEATASAVRTDLAPARRAKREPEPEPEPTPEPEPSAENLPGDYGEDRTRVGVAMPPIETTDAETEKAPTATRRPDSRQRPERRPPPRESRGVGRLLVRAFLFLVVATGVGGGLVRSGWLPAGVNAQLEPLFGVVPMLRPGTAAATPTAVPTPSVATSSPSPTPSATPDDDEEPEATGREPAGGGVFPGGGDDESIGTPTPRAR